MVKKENKDYDFLIDYIRKNRELLSSDEYLFLIEYSVKLKKQDVPDNESISKEQLLIDLIEINDYIKSGELTSLSFERLKKELGLFKALLEDEDLEKISYDVDKLYIENDLPIRSSSVLINTLKNNENDREISK